MTKKKDPSELKKAVATPVAEVKAEPVKASKDFKAINSSTVCQLCRRADRTFGITV